MRQGFIRLAAATGAQIHVSTGLRLVMGHFRTRCGLSGRLEASENAYTTRDSSNRPPGLLSGASGPGYN